MQTEVPEIQGTSPRPVWKCLVPSEFSVTPVKVSSSGHKLQWKNLQTPGKSTAFDPKNWKFGSDDFFFFKNRCFFRLHMLNFNGVNLDKKLLPKPWPFFGMVTLRDHLTLVGIVTSNNQGMKRSRFEWEIFPNQKNKFLEEFRWWGSLNFRCYYIIFFGEPEVFGKTFGEKNP